MGFRWEDDTARKQDPQSYDAKEDYAGPVGGGYFVLSEERDEQGRPLEFLTKKQARDRKAQKEAEADEMNAAMRSERELQRFRDNLASQSQMVNDGIGAPSASSDN